MSVCNFTTAIDRDQCIGDSRSVINTNFSNLDTATCNLSSVVSNLQLGTVIQQVYIENKTLTTVDYGDTNNHFNEDLVPTASKGILFMTAPTITPHSLSNYYLIWTNIYTGAEPVGNHGYVATVSRTGQTTCDIVSPWTTVAYIPTPKAQFRRIAVPTLSPTVFNLRVGLTEPYGNTGYLNGSRYDARPSLMYGGDVIASTMLIQEIKG